MATSGNSHRFMKVTIFKAKVRNKTRWVVARSEGGKRKRTFFDSRTAAEAEASALKSDIEKTGEMWFSLAPAQRARLMHAYSESLKEGVDISEAIRKAKECHSPRDLGPELQIVIDELLAAKTNAGRADRYVKHGLRVILRQFAQGRETLAVGRITLGDVESFLNSKSLASRSTLRARISTLFKFTIRRGYRTDNPCARLEPITVTKASPAVFTPEQAVDAARWLKEHAPRGLAWFALTTFCGLRPEEAEKTDTSRDINFKEGFVKVSAQTTKVRQRRVVYPRREAMAILKWALKQGGVLPLDHQRRNRIVTGTRYHTKDGMKWTSSLRQHLGSQVWPKDITRHTAASYWIAGGESIANVSKMLGNSERVLERDYRALVTQKDAERFWKIVNEITKL